MHKILQYGLQVSLQRRFFHCQHVSAQVVHDVKKKKCKGISQLSLSGTSLYRQYYRGWTVSTKLFREEKDAITKQCKNQQFYFLYLPS